MIIYHGSNKIIDKPNISFSKKYLDFGLGFYATIYKEQAEKWAKRKVSRDGGEALVSVYEIPDNLENIKVLSFENENEKWLDFVCSCRKGYDINNPYDVIIGNVADDDVFKTVDMYFSGTWDKERTISELKYYKMNNQICFVNQEVLENIVSFKYSYKVE